MSSNKMQSNKSNGNNSVTMKLKDIDTDKVTVEKVKMGSDDVYLMRYDGKTLYLQLSNSKLLQYGIPPGEKLTNGAKNEYYQGEDSRLSLRIPMDVKCAVSTGTDSTNEADILADISQLKKLDKRIKDVLFDAAGIDADDKEKYVPLYRKPAKSKKPSVNDKEKFYSVKAKFDTTNEPDGVPKKIKTEFWDLSSGDKQLVNGSNGYISLKEVEDLVTYKCEICPVVQLVKVWTQAKGDWGVTLKLKKIRVKQSSYNLSNDAEFLASDDEQPVVAKSSKTVSQVVAQQADSDSDSDDEPVQATPSKSQPAKKVVATVDSDSESDQEVAPVSAKKAPVKVQQVDSDSDSEEDTKTKKTAKAKPVTKSKKSVA